MNLNKLMLYLILQEFILQYLIFQGMMMYELHVPLVVLSNRALQRGPKKCKDPNEITKDLKVN